MGGSVVVVDTGGSVGPLSGGQALSGGEPTGIWDAFEM